MTEMDVLARQALQIADLNNRLDHLEYLLMQTIKVHDQHPDIDYVTDSESYKKLESALFERVYGKTESR